MITGFNEQLWIDFDLEIAVFLENLAAWLRINASKDNEARRNYHEGRNPPNKGQEGSPRGRISPSGA